MAIAATALMLSACEFGSRPPSILLVVVDTLRADRVGAVSGREPSRTPSLDRWASRGVTFRHASTPAPFTMPAAAALLTGVYPDRTGVVEHLPSTTLAAYGGESLAEVARRSGLGTAAIVANPWLARASTGFERGFETFERLHRRGQGTADADAVTDRALAHLEQFGDDPFFLWVHYFDPHMPYAPPAAFAQAAGAAPEPSRVVTDFTAHGRDLGRIYRGEGYSAGDIEQARRLYDGEVLHADREISRLLDGLARLGRERNTVVVVVSDHGESLGEHHLYFAHDFTLYEELTHVPLMISGPGVAPAAREDPVSLIDVMPTLCGLARLDCPEDLDGRDLLGKTPPVPTPLFAAATTKRTRGADFARLTVDGLEGRWTMIRDGNLKLLRIPQADADAAIEMYDVARDPAERHDIAGSADPSERQRLLDELERWMAEMDEDRPSMPAGGVFQRARDERTLRSLGYLQ